MVDSPKHRTASAASSPPAPWNGLPAGLLFDLADVLYDASMWSRWLVQLLHRLGLHTHYHAFVLCMERDFLVDAYRGRRPYWEAVGEFLRCAGLSRGQVDEVLVAARAGRRRFEQSLRPFPGVAATLRSLAASGVPTAVVTNSTQTSAQLRNTLRQLGLDGCIRHVLSSCELRRTLPDAEAYRAALAELELEPHRVAFVGHDALELSGAASAGLRTIAFNAAPAARADVYLARFEQLRQLVETRTAQLLAG